MRLGTASVAAALSAGAAFLGAAPAAAADMPAYYAPGPAPAQPDAPLEFGTGWYLRGDASFGPEDKPRLLVGNGAPGFARNATAWGYGFGGGGGYKFNDWFRADITADYLDPFHYRANTSCGTDCLINHETNVWRWDGLANGYVDLGTWFGITPYIGAGAGVAGTHTDGGIGQNGAALPTGIMDPRTGTLVTASVPSRTDYRFAWAGMAGFSYAFGPHMLADVGYRFLDLGRTSVPLFPIARVTRDVTEQQIRVGLRYMVD